MVHCVTCDKEGDWSLSGGDRRKKNIKGSSTSSCSLLEKELNVIFFIENLLDIPEDILNPTGLIERCGDPSNWIHFCDGCTKWVEEGREAYRNIIHFENILENCKRKVESVIKETWKRLEDEDEVFFNVNAAIRNTVAEGQGRRQRDLLGDRISDGGIKGAEGSHPNTSGNIHRAEEDKAGGIISASSAITGGQEDVYDDDDTDFGIAVEIEIDDFPDDDGNVSDDIGMNPSHNEEAGRYGYEPSGSHPIHNENSNNSQSYQLPLAANQDVMELQDSFPTDAKICPVCFLEFITPRHMRQHHSKKHHGDSSGRTCPECGKIFTWPSMMRKHYDAVHRQKVVCHCDKCGMGFKYTGLLKRHQLICSGSNTQTVTDGNASNNTNLNGKDHDLLSDSKPLSKCPFCPELFVTPGHVDRHVKIFHKSWECQICGDSFNQGVQYRNHVKDHLGSETGHKYLAGEKVVVLLDPDGNVQILKDSEHQGQNINKGQIITLQYQDPESTKVTQLLKESPTKCPVCHKEFPTVKSTKTHVWKYHMNERNEKVTCDECGEQIKKHNLPRHKKLKHGPPSDPLLCPLCGKKFKEKGSLTLHYKLKHDPTTDREKFKCPCCGRGFATNGYVRDHQRKMNHFPTQQ